MITSYLVSAAARTVITAFVTTRLMIFFVIYVSSIVIPIHRSSATPAAAAHNLVLDGLVRWDSWWYWSIVTHGYTLGNPATGVQGSAVFFPLYPLLVKVTSVLTHNVFVAGVLISNGAFFVALCYLYALAQREFDQETAGRAVFYIAAAPAAVFFAAMYTESLFVLLVTATFYYARAGNWGPAAIAGALAAATRNTGVFLAVVIALEGMSQQGIRVWPAAWQGIRVWPATWRRSSPGRLLEIPTRDTAGSRRYWLAAGCVPVGLLLYMAYLSRRLGDPLAFLHGQSAWKNVSHESMQRITTTIHNGLSGGGQFLTGTGQHSGVILLNGLATLAVAPLVIAVVVKMRPAYGVYAALTFFAPLIAGHGVISMIRFTLMLVPCFILLAAWGRRPWVDRLVLGVFLPLMAYLAITYSHWYQPV